MMFYDRKQDESRSDFIGQEGHLRCADGTELSNKEIIENIIRRCYKQRNVTQN